MKRSMIVLSLAALVAMVTACSSKPPAKPTTKPAANAAAKTLTVKVDGKDAMVLTLPAKTKTYDSNGKYTVVDPSVTIRFYVWTVAGAKTPDDAVAKVGELIKSEFTNFKQTGVKDVTVAGQPGKQVSGTGNEADDGDPGKAEVVLFKIGDHVFASCLHGERWPTAAEVKFETTALNTAKAP